MKKHFLILIFLLSMGVHAAENCEGAHIERVLDSMAAKYKKAVGDTLVYSELDEEWGEFSSFPVRTSKLHSGKAASLQELKDFLFEQIYHMYPYDGDLGWTGATLRPYWGGITTRPFEDILEYYTRSGDKLAYEKLEKVMLKDLSRVWGVWVGMETIKDSYEVGLEVFFLVGQTSCGYWVGLRVFLLST